MRHETDGAVTRRDFLTMTTAAVGACGLGLSAIPFIKAMSPTKDIIAAGIMDVDISGMIFSYPLDEVNDYIKRLVQAGFGKRIMYGTDFFSYPRMMEGSMSVIEHARYLGEDQKRDILFNNAARFFRLDKSQFDWPE